MQILGTIQAGFPTPADEHAGDHITIDEWLISRKDASFMLRVSGDSMRDAGIFSGDMIVVERTNNPKAGQIVIAEIDGSWTMKYLGKDPLGFYLRAANSDYPDLRPSEELKIEAVVKAVIRKYE